MTAAPSRPSRPSCPPRSPSALAAGRPVVALESTLLAHGLPRPDNRAAADEVEDAVRAGGAVPATIAVLDGVPHVGLTAEQLDRVCADPDLAKLGVRDLPVAARAGAVSGATTVSSTALLAARGRHRRCSPPAGWAACTGRRRRPSTSPPTWSRWPARRSSSSAPA